MGNCDGIHETWVHCWWWGGMINICVNTFWFCVKNCVLVLIIKKFLLFSIFYDVLFMCMNKVSYISVMVHKIDVVIEVNKVDWVHFRFITVNCSFWGTGVWCINILVEFFRSWVMLMIVLKYLLSCCIFLDKTGPWNSMFTFSCHAA